MKKVLILVGVAAIFAACNSNEASTSAQEAQEVAEATETSQSFAVNSESSSVNWTGSKVTGDSHSGTVAVKGGEIAVEEGKITSGNFTIDMSSLASTDGMDEERTGKLLGHLSSDAFFNVDSFATAAFEVTASTADSITGNLTIKGITHSITIPYAYDKEAATASSTFSIDRSAWDVRYGSSSFFDNLGDNVINDAIEFEVNLALAE